MSLKTSHTFFIKFCRRIKGMNSSMGASGLEMLWQEDVVLEWDHLGVGDCRTRLDGTRSKKLPCFRPHSFCDGASIPSNCSPPDKTLRSKGAGLNATSPHRPGTQSWDSSPRWSRGPRALASGGSLPGPVRVHAEGGVPDTRGGECPPGAPPPSHLLSSGG